MFKRKTVLPERPPLPTAEDILEDLKFVSQDDVVFQIPIGDTNLKTSPNISDDLINHTFGTKSTDFQNPYEAYQKVNAFVEKMDHFEKQIKTIEEQLQNIHHLGDSLKLNISEIKEKFENSEVTST